MLVTYELLKIDTINPTGSVLIPRHVVIAALDRFRGKQVLELSRYDENGESQLSPLGGDMVSRLSDAGMLLEVVGRITEMWIDGDMLKCSGELQDSLFWPFPRQDYMPVPYMDFKHQHVKDTKLPGCKRLITEATFTEVVLVYQAVTRLALRKYRLKRLSQNVH